VWVVEAYRPTIFSLGRHGVADLGDIVAWLRNPAPWFVTVRSIAGLGRARVRERYLSEADAVEAFRNTVSEVESGALPYDG
jgi:hypothetical protein